MDMRNLLDHVRPLEALPSRAQSWGSFDSSRTTLGRRGNRESSGNTRGVYSNKSAAEQSRAVLELLHEHDFADSFHPDTWQPQDKRFPGF